MPLFPQRTAWAVSGVVALAVENVLPARPISALVAPCSQAAREHEAEAPQASACPLPVGHVDACGAELGNHAAAGIGASGAEEAHPFGCWCFREELREPRICGVA